VQVFYIRYVTVLCILAHGISFDGQNELEFDPKAHADPWTLKLQVRQVSAGVRLNTGAQKEDVNVFYTSKNICLDKI